MTPDPDPPGEVLGVVVLAGLVSLVGVGVALASIGHFEAAVLFPTWFAVAALLSWIGRPRHGVSWRRWPHVAAFAVAAIVLVATALNVASAGAHIVTDRDPGIYAVSGRWLAGAGTIDVPGIAATPFGREPGVTAQSAPAFIQGDGPAGTLTLVRPAGWPVMLGAAQIVGGDEAMFILPAIIAAIALCFFAGLAWRLAGPWLAVVAVAALAVNLAQAWASRDTYAEVPTQALALGALWVLVVAVRNGHTGRAAIAGLAVGAGVAIHFPAVLVLTGLLASAAVEAWLDDGSKPGRRACYAVACATGAATSAVGLLAMFHWNGPYARAHESMIRTLLTITVLAALLYGAALVARRARWIGVPSPAVRRVVGGIAGGAVGLAAFFAWFVRPHVERARIPAVAVGGMENLQRAAKVAIEPTRSYSELTMEWLASYLGPVALALGLAGFAVACVVGLRRDDVALRLLLPLGVITTAIYCFRPSAYPDQPWVLRRYTPEVIPILLLFACWLLARAWCLRGRAQPVARVATVVAAVLMVAFPLAVLQPVARAETGRRYEDGLHLLCRRLGPQSAVLVVGDAAPQAWYPQTVQAFCGVPVGTLVAPDPAAVQRLAVAWRASGRKLVLLSRTVAELAAAGVPVGNADLITVEADRQLELTLNRPPDRYVRADLMLATVEVPG